MDNELVALQQDSRSLLGMINTARWHYQHMFQMDRVQVKQQDQHNDSLKGIEDKRYFHLYYKNLGHNG